MNIQKFVLFFFCIFTNTFLANQINTLKNVYNHRGNNNAYELATISFYFSAKPILKKISSESLANGLIKNTYTIYNAQLQQTILSTLPIRHKQYSLDVRAVGNALHLIITYNPRTIALVFDTFDSISLQKGLAIHVVHKNMCNVRKNKRKKPAVADMSVEALAKKEAMAGRQIVIDCGHGGSDAGAIGFGIKEKDITLQIGLQLAQLLKKSGLHVKLTRSSDVDVPLDERTSYANQCNADLFISIHANASTNKSAQGIDTFCIKPSLLHRENQLSDNVPFDALINARAQKSNQLAHAVHQSILTNVRGKYPTVVDRGIKHEVGQILLGAHMPAVLLEVGFVTHEQEAQRLANHHYQRLLVQCIYDGIMAYLKE